MAEHDVSAATARRWVLSGDVEGKAKRQREWRWLREACAANGTTPSARYTRKWAGYPLDAVAGPMKRTGGA